MTTSIQYYNHKKVKELMQYFCVEYGMLSFKSQANFMYVVEQIEQATEGNNDLYFYSDFDTITGFYSLRKHIQWCENKLQLADNLTIDNDPDNFFVRGDAFRCLLNVQLEVKVGDSIFKIINDDYSIEILDGDIRTLELARKNLKQTLQQRNVVLIDEKNNVPKNNYSKIDNPFNDNSSSKLFAGEVVPNENCPNWGFTVKSEKDGINPLKYNFQIFDDTTIPNFQRPAGYEIVEFFIYEYDVNTMSIKGSAIHTEVRPGLFFDYTFAKPGYYKYCFIITFPSNIPPCSYKVCDINPGSTKGVIEIKDKNASEIPNCYLTGGDNIGAFYNRDKNRADARLYLRNRLFTFTIGGYTKNYRKKRNRYVRDKAGRIYIKVEGNFYKGPVIDNKMRCINPVYYKKEEIKTNSSKAEVNKVFWGTGGLQKDSIKSEHFVENYNVRVFGRVLKMR